MCHNETLPPRATVPQTPTEYFEYYPTGLWDLGAILKPVRKIVYALMAREGLDYTQAIHCLVADHFVTPYAKYLDRYAVKLEATPGLDFLSFAKSSFVYAVRRSYAYNAERQRVQADNGFSVDSRPLDIVLASCDVKAGQSGQCPADLAIEGERNAERDCRNGSLLESLKLLDSTESFVVWNHAALGHTYDDVAAALGISATTAKKIYVGVVARLRRESSERERLGGSMQDSVG